MKFTKMHGIGNDYVYVNCFKEKIEDPSALAVRISDRHFRGRIGWSDPDQPIESGRL